MMFDLVIQDGLIVDGTGRDSFGPLDIGIKDGRIIAIEQLKGLSSKRKIEARGLYVAPGFIDIHSHSDLAYLVTPPPESKIAQGVTTEVIGNCGLSAAPCFGASKDKMDLRCRGYGVEMEWESLGDYLDLLEERGLVSNIIPLVGQGNLRGSIIGYDNRPAMNREVEEMKGLLARSFSEGAVGLSAGLAYPPGCYTRTEELIELASTLLPIDGIFVFHLRSETEGLVEAVSEVLRIAELGIKVHISHLKASAQNRKNLLIVLEMIEKALSQGIKISCDFYPYLASSTDLDILLPSWAWEGGREKELLRLKDPAIVDRMRQEILSSHLERDYWKKVVVSSVNSSKNKWMEGQSLSDIAKGGDVLEALFNLLIEEGLKVEANFFFGDEDNLREILRRPYAMVSSDALARSKEGIFSQGRPHPRAFGTFARILSMYVQKERLLPLEEAIYKMTGLPSLTLGLTDRGRITEGNFADLVVFDPLQIEDLATYEDPFQYPTGIEYTIVNGRVVWENGAWTGEKPGKVLKRNGG